jgi:hypothetical protein
MIDKSTDLPIELALTFPIVNAKESPLGPHQPTTPPAPRALFRERCSDQIAVRLVASDRSRVRFTHSLSLQPVENLGMKRNGIFWMSKEPRRSLP